MAVIDRLQSWLKGAGELPLRHLPPDEHVAVNERQHPAVLIPKAVRTGSGVGMLITGPTIGLALLFAGATLVGSIRAPSQLRRRTVVLLVAALTGALLLVGSQGSPILRALAVVCVLFWMAADTLTWFYDRLIVTDRRLYRVHGLLTTHRPSVALQTITVVDLEMGPAGRWFGTLRFDTPAQRDGPLHRFTYVRDAGQVHVMILQLRAAASAHHPPQL